ncbi:cysteine desulfurase [Corynebacterium phocae]|uniref:Cysteine desulfurase n=1 Tax=Corynebacterium phocae TaxID=161895 RepID=A0A1L7D0L0_9CORY|nr:aminotransferase class V-fold PLP-dependent enzyme [Corynebacterium phocae]APT91685.1 cysteine desulfurase [Corynebacterium phocae]KAA8728594.1 aminotransferase class V-fold PLP-dependent enzyme [Corynebacterium phocae]
MSSYDAASVRGLYAGLSDGWTYLNAHAAPQVAEKVASGVARSFRMSNLVAQPDAPTGSHSARAVPGQLEGDGFVASARMAVADLVGARPDVVVLGPSLPVLYQSLARALKPLLRRNSSAVLSRLDPPELYSAFSGLCGDVRWAQPDLGTGELPAFQYDDLVDGSTRLVVASAAHESLGTIAPVAEILEKVRARSRAWTVLDVTALAPYRPVDIHELGVDIVGVDLGQLGGPQIAALVFRDTSMFKRLDTLNPVKHEPTAAKLETPVSAGMAGGVGPLVDHLAGLAAAGRGSRRNRLHKSMGSFSEYIDDLRADLYIYLSALPQVHIMGYSGEAAAGASNNRLPRLTFAVQGVPAETVHQRLFDNQLVTTVAPSTPLLDEMGLHEIGGGVTIGLGPFNTHADIEHLTRVVASLA